MDQMKRQVDRIRENVADARKELEGYEEFRREAVEKTQKYAEEDENLCRLEDEVTFEEKRLSDEINRLRDREKRISQAMEGRLRILEGMRCNMADEAWRWYEQNREKFRYPVYVPILHMTVPNTESAMLLENLIAIRDFPMFIFGLESLSAGRPDIEHARAALNEAKTNASREVHKMVLKMLTKMGQLRAIYVDDSLLRIALQGLRETLSKAESQLHDAQQKLQDNLALLEGRATRFREVMRELARAKEVLQEHCGISTIDPDKITKEEGNILEQLEKVEY
ncbi:hypothetical protein NECAME_17405 [Necator americanus]|uniref:Uncharacterized protein n=1 Tax=Necator americanus TaxID=51031 RepID=W2TPL1_NECAM|nr:hypothetical protein NECAME_17405 [Necator americanus]ETN83619.1 hypothetical protein NECAME_17405 [Necator americanus]